MDNFKLYTEYSPWFILLCIAAGFIYAFVLYQKKNPWSDKINKVLFALRFTLVTILCILLIGPFIKHFKNYIENPTVVFAIDNSQSVNYGNDSTELKNIKKSLQQLSEELKKEDIKIDIQLLDKNLPADQINNITFNNPSTNLSQLLNGIQSNFENRNLGGVILLSDGIYNQGMAPNYNQYSFPLFTIGLGDTIPKKDINLKTVLYNKISYQGNLFPIVAEIHNTAFKGEQVDVNLKQGGKIIQKKSFTINKESDITEIEFLQSSEKKGLQHYVVEVENIKGEFTYKNNIAHVYIDIIEGKENILIVALTPHPDIKALKNALENKENYEVDTYIQGLNEFKEKKYDLVIFHQLPDQAGTAKILLEKFSKDKTSILYIIGNQTNIVQLNSSNNLLKINARRGQYDNCTPGFNVNFDKFKIEPEEQAIINSYPPLAVPFADFELKEQSDIILYQKIGSVLSSKPLLVINNTDNKKTGVLMGEGMWEWRLHEFNINKNTQVFDKLISNLIQYLSSKEDKRKFRVYPIQNEFVISDRVLFETEIYNDVYEKIYGKKVDLKIIAEDGNSSIYSYITSENNPRFEVKGLKSGIYKYIATTDFSGKTEKSEGEFTIKELMLEAINTTANHEVLRLLSNQTKGKFFLTSEIDKMRDHVKASAANSIIHSSEEFVEMINLTWIFFLLLALVSAEWFLRRYKGGY